MRLSGPSRATGSPPRGPSWSRLPHEQPAECEWVAGNSQARAVICENEGQTAKIDQIRAALPALEHVIGIEPGIGDMSLADLRARGRDRDPSELDVTAGSCQP